MKEYPSIPRDFVEFDAHVFDKLDGSNIRVEYSRKQGWHKFGKRHTLVDASDPILGSCVKVFRTSWDDSLSKLAEDGRWQSAVLFFEFYGPSSFAGWHDPVEPKRMTLIDACLDKNGFMSPKDFLKTFDGLDHAPYLGSFRWTRGFIDRVWLNEVPGISFEGVVGKGGEKHKRIMRKAKTQQWIDKVHTVHGTNAEKIINS